MDRNIYCSSHSDCTFEAELTCSAQNRKYFVRQRNFAKTTISTEKKKNTKHERSEKTEHAWNR